MKKILILSALIFGIQFGFSQAWKGQGDQKIQFGLNGWGNGTGITATYDYGIANEISVGAGANFYFSGYRDSLKDNNLFIFGRVNYHLQNIIGLPSNWDIYPGLDVGILGKNFGLGAHLGVRYFFNDKFGAFLEVGNNGSLGISINL